MSSSVNNPITNLTLGVSSCLLGELVRFNGGHKLSRFVRDTLGAQVELQPVCPEAAIGLGVPRPPIRLIASDTGIRVVDTTDASRDHTQALRAYGEKLMADNPHWSGFIGAGKSPSCGAGTAKVYRDGAMPDRADGMVVQAMRAACPWFPIEDEGRLHDAALRENFVLRVYVYAAFQHMRAQGLTAKAMIAFWTRHKFLVLAHNQKLYRAIGPMLSDLSVDLERKVQEVFALIMQALSTPATRHNHANALSHLQGFVKTHMTADDKHEWTKLLASYREGHVPLVVPVTLLNHYVRRYGNDYVRAQYYLHPYPAEFGLRNAVMLK